jgi:adenine phosphoribosyltransferase
MLARATDRASVASRVTELMREVPDYPEPGVLFRDITPVLADAQAFAALVAVLAAGAPPDVDLVAGMESRGFLLAAPIAVALGAGLVPVRKQGKLPGPTIAETYELEYGTATLELHPFTVPEGARVLVVDDVLATGGTAAATIKLFDDCGAQVVGLAVLAELVGLGGRAKVPGVPIEALLSLP